MPTSNDTQNRARLFVGLIVTLVGFTGVTALLLGPATHASAQAIASWSYTGNLNAARFGHTATLLPDGRVLVVGGYANCVDGVGCQSLNSAELYDPAIGTWSVTGNLNTARAGHTATLLPDGRVLIVGGNCGSGAGCPALNSAELYEPASGAWITTGNLNKARVGHTATLLQNGKVLVAGGFIDFNLGNLANGAELYDPITGTWSNTVIPNTGRAYHTATLLPNGKVLVAGGITYIPPPFIGDSDQPTNRAELYDPSTGTWTNTGNLNTARYNHTATLLSNGEVLVGSFIDLYVAGIVKSAELYNPTTGIWSYTANVIEGRTYHTTTLLTNGKVLVAGGYNWDSDFFSKSAELYDPTTTGSWSGTANLNTARADHTATLLQSGKVLVVGGTDGNNNALNSAELYDPGTNAIDDAQFFVRQHYLDFLNREPDAPGWAHWTGEITECTDVANRLPGETETQCIDRKRSNTSGAFYLSNEFQNSANFLIRVNWGSVGQDRAPGRKCIEGEHSALDAVCNPLYSQYLADMTTLTHGIVVNDQLDPSAINANKHNFVAQFVTRANFLAAYPDTMTAAEYVDKLSLTTGIPLTTQERSDLIAEVATTGGRASVLYKIVDGTTTIDGGFLRFDTRYGKAFYDQEFNPAFVFVEYLGYLRRNPDQAGYDHWLGKLNLYGNFVDAEMVRSFIVSNEYRSRFGP